MESDKYLYEMPHTIIYSEISARGLLSLPSFFSLFQEAALLQADELDFGTEYCNREGLMWVLSRLSLEIASFPEHRSRIRVLTWPKKPQGPFASREFLIEGADGMQHARATSSWLLLNSETMRPVRPQPLFEGYPFDLLGEAISGPADKITEKGGECEEELKVTARYSDLDQNKHVNNTRYVRWFLDCYRPEEITPRKDLRFVINYLKAASFGDTLTLCRYDSEGTSTVRGFSEDGGESFVAQIQLP